MNTMPDHHSSMHAIIGKYLAGEANAVEAMLLHDWLSEGPNALEFEQVKKLWEQLPGNHKAELPSAAAAWQELQPILLRPQKPALLRFFQHRFAAAVIIGSCLFVGLLWLWQKPATSTTEAGMVFQTYTTGQEMKTTMLPDGTTITLHHNSTIGYNKGYGQQNRPVTLQGEAFFQVKPDKDHPFLISIAGLTIQVLGTSFNVREITPPGLVEVQVQTGVVKMFTSQKEILVHKGQTGFYDRLRGVLNLKDTLDSNSFGYATRSFSFNDMPFTAACRYLERAFPGTVMELAPELAACRLSAQFDQKPLPYILEIINATLHTTYQQQGDTIRFRGKGCR